MDVNGKTIVITGASSGIGEVAAKQLARQGARVCLVARREDELWRVQGEIEVGGGQAWVYVADLSDTVSIESCADAILQEHSRIDVLVNNAAHSIRRSIQHTLGRVHDYERTMQLNFFGAVRLTLKLLPRFLEQGEGHVVNISTMSTQFPVPLFSAYIASKSALESFSRSLLAELGHKGLAVTVVYFPMVRTPMSSKTDIYKHMRMMDVDTAAGWIVKAVRNRPARVGSALGAAGSVALAAVPGLMTRLVQPVIRGMDKQLARRLDQDGGH